MARFLVRRLAGYAALTAIAASLAYLLAATALDPRANYEGRNPPPPAAVVDATLDEYNLNDRTPLTARYLTWAEGLLHGDLGHTWDGGSVGEEMDRRMWVSLRLLLIGTLVGCAAGVLLGAYSSVRQYRAADRIIGAASFTVLSTPVFVLATLLTIAAVDVNNLLGFPLLEYTGEFTPGIEGGFWAHLGDRLSHLVLPTLTITLLQIAVFSRYQRNMMLDVLGADFVRTAMAKGLPRRAALLKHGLRTALIPAATYFAFTFGTMFVGATFTEKIFNWPGMGAWLVDSINSGDVNAVASITLFTAVLILLAGMLADVLTVALDPRVRVR